MITGTACEAGENNGNDKNKSLTVVKLQHGINEAAEIHAAFDSRGVKWNEIDCLNWRKDYPYKPEAQFRIAHDGQNIYVEYHVKEDAVRAVNGNDQSAVFQDACCEFFLMLDGEDTYYNIESNCIGAILMQCGRQGGEREDASAAVLKGIRRWASLGKETFETRIGKQEWRLTLIIPAASLFQSNIKSLDGMTATANFFKYDGDIVMKGGTLKLNNKNVSSAGIGSASKLIMHGGQFVTVGKNESSVTYNFPIEAVAGTTSTVDFDLWNTNKCKVSGTGTLIWNVHYLREYIEGNWDDYTGHLIINGTGKANQSQFAVRNGVGVKNATIELKGTASLNGGKNQSTFYLGGLSGESTTALSGFNVKQKGEGTWIVGGANTDETFRGVIDDYDQAHSHPGKTSIEKQGTGEWRLTGKNTYSGTTIVTAGTMIVNGQHTGTGAITVRKGATLAGKGKLSGATTINIGGTLLIGDTLSTDKGLTFTGGLKLNSGAILRLNDAMMESTHKDGDEIKAFTGTVTGTFSEIQPATPGEGQTWDVSRLYSEGVLVVVGQPSSGISTYKAVGTPQKVEYFTLKGERLVDLGSGLYIQRMTMHDGSIISRKIVK